MLVSEIATLLNYEMVGEDCEIDRISWAKLAGERDIAVLKRAEDAFCTIAKVVLTKPIIINTEKTLLVTFEDIECSLAKVCELLIQHNVLPDFSTPTKYTLIHNRYYVGANCNIGKDVFIQPGVMIGDNVFIGDGCVIEPYSIIGSGTILGERVHIGSGSKIGISSFYHYYDNGKIKKFDGCGVVKIENDTCIGCNTVIQRGTISDTIISSNCMIGNCIDIGHDVKIGENCKIVSQTGIAGDAIIKNNVLIYGQVGISNNIVIGNNVIIKGRTLVTKSINDNETVYGPFGRKYSEEMKFIAKLRHLFEGKEK